MKTWSPSLWALWAEGVWHGHPPQQISGMCLDSRRIRAGEGFIAIGTEVRDGHDYLKEARDKGAAFALVESGRSVDGLPCLEVRNTRYALTVVGRELRKMFSGAVIGVSGSCGKTSTKEILSVLLGERAYKTPGNLNNDLGLPLSLLSLNNEDHDYGILEIGINHAGEMEDLANLLQPDYALITSVAPAHLEGLGSIQNVAAEKAQLLYSLSAESRAYFPAECAQYPSFREIAGCQIAEAKEPVVGGSRATVRRYHRQTVGNTTILSLEPDTSMDYVLHSAGEGMVRNAAIALYLALDLGVSAAEASARIALWRPSAMRAQWKQRNGYPVLLDCYNSNPASLREAGGIFHQGTRHYGKRLWVLGGMKELGDDAEQWHMRIASELPVAEGDTVLGVGEEAVFYEAAVRRIGEGVRWLHVYDATEGIQWVEEFDGPMLFKGSRGYALEKMLPMGLMDIESKEMENLC